MRLLLLSLPLLIGCIKQPQLSKQDLTQKYEAQAVRAVVNGEGVTADDVEVKSEETIVRGETVMYYAQVKGAWFKMTCDPIGCDYYKVTGPPGVETASTQPTSIKSPEVSAGISSGVTSRDPEPEADLSSGKEFDPNRAFQLAVALTLSPPGLGFIYGPSAGHFYAGEVGRGMAMTLLRAALFVVPIASQVQFAKGEIEPGQFIFRSISASVGISVLTLIDLLDASNAARRANAK